MKTTVQSGWLNLPCGHAATPASGQQRAIATAIASAHATGNANAMWALEGKRRDRRLVHCTRLNAAVDPLVDFVDRSTFAPLDRLYVLL